MEAVLNILYFIFFLVGTILCLKILMSSNLEKVFKQGKIFEIRLAHLILSFIFGFLLASSIIKIIEVMYNLVNL